MRKGLISLFAIVALIAAGMAISVAYAQNTKSGEVSDVISIKDPLFGKYQKSPVEFTHLKHTADHKLGCDQCHHIFKDGKNVFKEGDKVEKCATCHNSAKKDATVDGKKMLSLYNAFHKNCRDCHKEAKKGPTKCDECHPKK